MTFKIEICEELVLRVCVARTCEIEKSVLAMLGGKSVDVFTLGHAYVWCFLVLSDFLDLNSRKENEQLSTYIRIKPWGYA